MANSKQTKRALLASALAIVACVAMLIGSTFAWFTDTASTAVNRIEAGTLKMKVEYSKDATEWIEISPDRPIFDQDALWEPGRTEVVYVRVTNVGSLALRYDFDVTIGAYSPGIDANDDAFELQDYLMFGAAKADTAYTGRDEAIGAVADTARLLGNGDYSVAKQTVLLKGESTTSALVLYMPTTVGNEANNVDPYRQPSVELGVKLNATQATVESDSYGPDYDANAPKIFEPVEISRGKHVLKDGVRAGNKWGAVQVNGGELTIEADVYATAKGDAAVAVWASRGTVIINSGYFAQEKPGDATHYDFIYASEGGKIEINGGTFKAATPQWTLNCKDGSNSTITVRGGSFYQFDPSNANVGNNEIIVPTGYKVVQNGDWYTVVAG